ncbi:elongator complex protein 1, putative [Acanthamoeba castellanii str. Neff]|uniref:Elongator complex protein 1 n=1 Tax=Acanthamoeba castellanii (strain ATCC 30010 / Neff) TaxID=1257118 RepID=L8H0V8_ACACF|nr:elongator complex protein 1, putative [Acanthamoeba castellanii str. Neff]ELR18862.1 elongator complex protein 1, putative [Acanthamoeba castellanii str. Neff]
MRNLVVLQELRSRLPAHGGDASLEKLAVDPYLGIIYVITKDKHVIGLAPFSNEVTFTVDVSDVIPPSSVIVAAQFVPDLGSVCYATATGELVVFNAECVGFIDSEIRGMSWSPDYELMILVTGNRTILSMTQEWEIVTEVPLQDEPQAQTKADDEGAQSNLPSLSWRGDGNYFAVNSLDADGERRLRVFDRSLVLDSVSAATSNLEEYTCWRPSGSSIGCSQQKPNKHDIIFFERNGLRLDRMDFTLRDEAKVIAMQWNSNSDILAVGLQLLGSSKDQKKATTVVQLYSFSNYHWYMKQEFKYHDWELADLLWDPENPMNLTVICRSGHLMRYHLCWDPTISDGNALTNESVAAVVDGASVLLTPFKRVVLPPPMYSTKLDCPANVSSVSFAPRSYDIGVLLADNTVALWAPFDTTSQRPPFKTAPGLRAVLALTHENEEKTGISALSGLRQLHWIDANTLLVVESVTGGTIVDYVVQVQFEVKEGKAEVTKSHRTPVDGRLVRLFHNKDTERVFVEVDDGSVLEYIADAEMPILEDQVFQFKGPGGQTTVCPWVATAVIAGEESFIGLNDRSKLFLNEHLLSSECNSFALHSKFLCFATLGHKMRFVSLSAPYREGSLDISATQAYDDTVRELERGSVIVCVCPNDIKVVLQMPRGNLEGIFPRMLSLSVVKDLLDRHEYRTVFTLMRNHRIDLNLFYDHNPQDFLSRVEDFIKQVDRVDFLNLFLSSLSDEDVTTTLFATMYTTDKTEDNPTTGVATPAPAKGTKVRSSTKVNTICDAMREALKRVDAKKYLLSILTSYVKKVPPALEEALLMIRDLRNQQPAEIMDPFAEEDGEKGHKEKNPAEEAMKYIVFLVDVNDLYNVALGMYDFDLVMMVAQHSQKDPKEYLPFLQQLQGMPKYVQRYTIDDFLGRHEKALENLSQADESYFPQCIELMKKHKLYRLAMDLFKNDQEKHKQVLCHYAKYLVFRERHHEAGLIFKQIGDLDNAVEAFKNAVSWQLMLATCQELDYSDYDLQTAAQEMADLLANLSRYREAALVYERYADDPETAIVTLIDGGCFTEALRLCYLHKRKDLIETHLQPASLEQCEKWKNKIEKKHKRFLRHKERLPIARGIMRAKMQDAETYGGPDEADEVASMVSEVSISSSVSSHMSTATGTSTSSRSAYDSVISEGGTRRRVRRPGTKRVTGKEGSPREEEWLVTTMRGLVPSDKLLSDMKELLDTLVLFGHMAEAKDLHATLAALVALINSSADMLDDSECLYVQRRKARAARKAAGLPLGEEDEEEVHTKEEPKKLIKNLEWDLSLLTE